MRNHAYILDMSGTVQQSQILSIAIFIHSHNHTNSICCKIQDREISPNSESDFTNDNKTRMTSSQV